MTDELYGHGVRVRVPRDWEAEIATLDDDVAPVGDRLGLQARVTPRVRLHLANFALPAERGDYGSNAVEIMDGGGVLIVVLEFDAASASTPLFAAEGVPVGLVPGDFSPDSLQRRLPGQGGAQRFFHVGSRSFGLYVVLGSLRSAPVLVREVNRLLEGVSID